jgi:hypothetical protein
MNKISKCRSCDNKKIKFLFSLGNIPYSGIFPKKDEKIDYGNLSLVICAKCNLVQLDRNFNSKKMYGNNYGYRTGLNLDMVNHMKNKAKKLNRYLIEGNKTIVDIGSNDGTFLNFLKTVDLN